MKKAAQWIFFVLVVLTLLTPFFVFKDLLFPYITSKAFPLRIIIEIAFPFYAYLLLTTKHYRPQWKNPLHIAIVLFVLFNLLAALFGVNITKSLWGNFERMGGVWYIAHLALLYFYIVLLAAMGQNFIRKFLQCIIASGVAMSLYGAMVLLTSNHFLLADPSYPRISATLGNPIFFASFLILPLFLSLYFAASATQTAKRWMYSIFALIDLWGIGISLTRGAIVGLVGGIVLAAIVYVLYTPSRTIKKIGGAAILVGLLAVGILFGLHNKIPHTSRLYRISEVKDANSQARLIQWKTALKGFVHKPVLGVGPENYYVIANQYYNPEIFKYDRSWFDKPHNYLLEILVTSGVFGFAAYAAMLWFSVVILYKSFKAELLSLAEFCILLAGMLVYQIQNLFVFDTIAASIMFFCYLGFIGYLWQEYIPQEKEQKNNEKITHGFSPEFSGISAAVITLIVVYALYVTNILGMQIAKAINYGYAYSAADITISQQYFDRALSLPFNFDPLELASKYADVASSNAQNGKKSDPKQVTAMMDNAVATEEAAIERVPNDPTAWQRLSNLYLNQTILKKQTQDNTPDDYVPKAEAAIERALALAPNRPELEIAAARVKIFNNDVAGAQSILTKAIQTIPTNTDAMIELALLDNYNKQQDQAVTLGEQALAVGYIPPAAGQISWLGDYYFQQKKYADAVRIYVIAAKAEPTNLDVQGNLAQSYALNGQKKEAIETAEAIIKADPTKASLLQPFINSLQK